jgi:hypothetical protein
VRQLFPPELTDIRRPAGELPLVVAATVLAADAVYGLPVSVGASAATPTCSAMVKRLPARPRERHDDPGSCE